MSTSTPSPNPSHTPPIIDAKREIRIVSHSNLFYWWPVWAIGFLLSLLTYFSGFLMVVVPTGTVAELDRPVANNESRNILVLPAKDKTLVDPGDNNKALQPK